jgi:hypothetical protein
LNQKALTEVQVPFGTGQLIGRHGIFAVPESVAGQSTVVQVARTGLMPANTANAIPIPQSAASLFRQPIPIGPYSAIKYLGGVQYAPPGSINMATGAFTSSSTLVGPGTMIYGTDAVIYSVGIGTGISIWNQPSRTKK